jgi:hypothetical protein
MASFTTQLAKCTDTDVLMWLLEFCDGIGRISRDGFVRFVALVSAATADRSSPERLLRSVELLNQAVKPVASFAVQFFHMLERCAQRAGFGTGDPQSLYFTFAAAAILGSVQTGRRAELPFLLHDPRSTGYIGQDKLQEFVYATLVSRDILEGSLTKGGTEANLATKRKQLGYSPLSAAQASLLAPSKRTSAVLASVHSATVAATSPRLHAISPSVPYMEGIPEFALSGSVGILMDTRIELLHKESNLAGSTIVDDCRNARFGVQLAPSDVVESLVGLTPNLSQQAYALWLKHNVEAPAP